MARINHYSTSAQKRRLRVRSKLSGTTTRPRLSVYRSNKHLAMQAIDDTTGKTLLSANDVVIRKQKSAGKKVAVQTKTESGIAMAQVLFERLQQHNITSVIFDRGSYKYHGRIKAVVEELRKLGIKV